jgi:superfamily I DNA/RNA helicase/RecB family exonuclease
LPEDLSEVSSSTTSAPLDRLDLHQQEAVEHGDGPAIVLAGPGSGKTRVIVERSARLVDQRQARPEQLLVLTFSRKAATDLRERIAARLRRSYASFPVTTFHAFCLAVLTRSAQESPAVVRPAIRRRLIREALEAEHNLGLRQTRGLVEEALRFAELCDDYLVLPEHPLLSVRRHYLEALDARRELDYGGLQRAAIELLERDETVRAEYRDQFRYLLVDEYQDTNVAQDRLLELIAGEHGNVFCVADEDQSIYGFRGAEIDNTLRFSERWPGARRYDLPTNYRSGPKIVGLATSVIRRNIETHLGKELVAAHDFPAETRGRTFRHAAEEADWIARQVANLRNEGAELGEVAILARSLREVGPRIAYALRRHGIPFYAPLAPQLHPTVDAVLSLLELADAYPWEERHNDLALRALASPLFNADPLELRPYRRTQRTLFGALRDSGDFHNFFKALAIVKKQRSAGAAVFALWDRLDHFRSLQVKEASRGQIEELAALTALSDAANEFGEAAADFPQAFRTGQLEQEDWLPTASVPAGTVALLTVHQAKGLEWDAVFVCDLVEGRFPALARSQYALFDRDLFTEAPLDEAARASRALEEERRLFYVAITRARTQLFLTATEEGREEAGRSLSRFYLEAHPYLDEAAERDGIVSSGEAVAALRRAGGGESGWRAVAETANPNPMVPDGGLWTSASRLAPYEDCPLRFFYGSLLEIGGTRTSAMQLGGVFHDVLEQFHDPARDEPQTLERLLALAENSWKTVDLRPRALADEQRRHLDEMLTQYFECEVAPGLDSEVLAVERRFRFGLDTSTISGYIDRIDRLIDGKLRLIDYKTSRRAMKKDDAEGDLQLALYAVACSEVEELRELGEVAELVYLYPRLIAYGKLARRGQTVTPQLVGDTTARVRENIAQIATERFDFSPEADCTFCDFRTICPRHHLKDLPL